MGDRRAKLRRQIAAGELHDMRHNEYNRVYSDAYDPYGSFNQGQPAQPYWGGGGMFPPPSDAGMRRPNEEDMDMAGDGMMPNVSPNAGMPSGEEMPDSMMPGGMNMMPDTGGNQAPWTVGQTPMMPMDPVQVPVPPMPPSQNGPPPVFDIQYIPGYLYSNIGRFVRCEFSVSNSQYIDKSGRLVEVGVNYFVLQDVNSRTNIMCDLYSVKFVTVLMD